MDHEEKARRLGVPVIPPIAPMPPRDPNPVIAICGECGLELRQVMHYACGQARCPVKLGGSCCLATGGA
jgi:hypothetical protein